MERRIPPEKDVGDDADAPHVHRGAVWCGLEDLRCDIYEDQDKTKTTRKAILKRGANQPTTTPSITLKSQVTIRTARYWLGLLVALPAALLALEGKG